MGEWSASMCSTWPSESLISSVTVMCIFEIPDGVRYAIGFSYWQVREQREQLNDFFIPQLKLDRLWLSWDDLISDCKEKHSSWATVLLLLCFYRFPSRLLISASLLETKMKRARNKCSIRLIVRLSSREPGRCGRRRTRRKKKTWKQERCLMSRKELCVWRGSMRWGWRMRRGRRIENGGKLGDYLKRITFRSLSWCIWSIHFLSFSFLSCDRHLGVMWFGWFSMMMLIPLNRNDCLH